MFLGHNAEASVVMRKQQQQQQHQATASNRSSASAFDNNRMPYLREQSITPDDSYYEDPGGPEARQSFADGGESRYVSEDPVSMGLYASRGSMHDESQVITDESVEKMLSSLREQFAKQNGRLLHSKAAKKGTFRNSR